MARMRLSPGVAVITTEAGVLLHSDVGDFVLRGPDADLFVDWMLPLLDGTRDGEEVADSIPEYAHDSVQAFLDLLERRALLETVLDTENDGLQARWRSQKRLFRARTDSPDEAARKLREACVVIAGLEAWGVVAAAELAAAGVGTLHLLDDAHVLPEDLLSVRLWGTGHIGRPRGQALQEVLSTAAPWCRVTTGPPVRTDHRLTLPREGWHLVLGGMPADDLAGLKSLAHFAHEAGLVSLFGCLQGEEAVLGPAVTPGQTACWNCCRLRLLANADHPREAHALQDALLHRRAEAHAPASLPPMSALVGHLLALEALKLLSHYAPSPLLGRLLFQHTSTLETTLHTIIPMPWCEVCGGASAMSPRESQPGPLASAQTPEALRRALAGWVDQRTGVIPYLLVGSSDAMEPGLPVCASAILSVYTEGVYNPLRPEGGYGKGLTATEALMGAAGEAMEHYSAARFRLGDLHLSSLNDLTGESMDPRLLCLYEESQYCRPGFPFARFDPDRPIYWTQGRWLDTGEAVWVPALPTFLGFPATGEELFCQVTSNGLAAGADLEDASLRAVFELVERDAFMLTWLCRLPGRRLIVDDSLEPGTNEILRQLRARGAKIELYLLNVGLSIPTVICLGLGDGRSWPGVTAGLGTHLSPRLAARKAILEHGQTGPYFCRLMVRAEQPIPSRPQEVRTSRDHALFYAPAERAVAFDFLRSGGDKPLCLGDLDEPTEVPLADCARRLAGAGVRTAIVNVTAPDVNQSPFRVARALGTYLQPIYFGFGLERQDNPRLRALLKGRINPDIHPLC